MLNQTYSNEQNTSFNPLYLRRLSDVLDFAFDDHPRTLAVRVDLRLSPDWVQEDSICCTPNLSKDLLTRFICSLKAKIRHYRKQLLKAGKRAHRCTLRYFWVREINTETYPHYHVVLFLNKDLFRGLGDAHGPQSLWEMIQAAWLSALNLREYDEYRSLVHFPERGVYALDRNHSEFPEQLKTLVFRISYLAKEYSKVYSAEERSMGCSLK
ncbi:inovirus Gp2 family protein [Leminorella grimontii]|uniref:inovirus Gp2 family protein n=1 Tax=Leminorella grimontii TaxID=82981 RepID=UPI00047F2C4B|nr:inovirus Gp2 family protein [Leminorella grimontii]KFC97401.1 inovirus Gp2 family protein [Leminorella grimontii ATCC 33999 = DSM 5078]VFS56728.1 Protein of uncharacterised function (DUF3296) [Leminorella grimontii]